MNSKPDTTISQSVKIPASPAAVYRALTDPVQHTAFTGMKAEGEPAVGNRFSAFDGYITAKYLELEPGRRIVQEWQTNPLRGASGWPEGYPPSILEITLEPEGEGTTLKMEHKDVPPQDRNAYEKGWQKQYWEPLIKYFSKR